MPYSFALLPDPSGNVCLDSVEVGRLKPGLECNEDELLNCAFLQLVAESATSGYVEIFDPEGEL